MLVTSALLAVLRFVELKPEDSPHLIWGEIGLLRAKRCIELISVLVLLGKLQLGVNELE